MSKKLELLTVEEAIERLQKDAESIWRTIEILDANIPILVMNLKDYKKMDEAQAKKFIDDALHMIGAFASGFEAAIKSAAANKEDFPERLRKPPTSRYH